MDLEALTLHINGIRKLLMGLKGGSQYNEKLQFITSNNNLRSDFQHLCKLSYFIFKVREEREKDDYWRSILERRWFT